MIMVSGDIKTLIQKNIYLTGQKGDWMSYWQDVANFCLPRKAWITTIKIYGEQLKFNYLYDSRAILALKKSASGFHSNLTNPSSKWFSFRTLNEKFMQSGNVQRYFKEVDDIQYGVINNSNFNESMLEYYTDDLCFGSTCLMTEEDHKTDVRYTSIPIEQINVELDERGELYALYRNFKWTAMQCQLKFGDNGISKDMKDALKDEKGYQKFDILHYVGPRDKRDVSKKDNANMSYRSVWICPKEEHKLYESGFTSNPYDFERFWVHSDDTYGYSPAMDVLASIKLANAQKRTLIRRAMKDSDQSTAQPSRFWMGRLNQNPSAMNYYDKTKFTKEDFFTIPTGGNPQLGIEMMQMEQSLIDEGFFINLFQAMTRVTKDLNVPETQKIISESLSMIGPVVGRMVKGISRSQVRTYEILNRRLLFPLPPKEIQGQNLNLVFLSPLAKAQRTSELQGLVSWLGLVGNISNIAKDAIDKVDIDRVIDGSADLFSVDPSFLKEQSIVDDIRKQRMMIQQQQLQMQQASQMAETARTGAQAGEAHAKAQAQ